MQLMVYYNLTVTNPDGSNQSKPAVFTVKKPSIEPTMTNISPKTGVNLAPVPVTITGTDFRTEGNSHDHQ